MDTTMLIKTKKDLKIQAQNLAKEMGLPLGTLVNNYLRNFIVDRQVIFKAWRPGRKPTSSNFIRHVDGISHKI